MRLLRLFSLLMMIGSSAPFFAQDTPGKVPVIQIDDSIHVGTHELIQRVHKEALQKKAPALLIELDTPGGYLEATRQIVQLFLNSDLPIIVWVRPQGARAASAGAMISMAAHFAAMSPSTSIGAATPVSTQGEIPKEMKAKLTNDTLSFVEGIALKRGRNVEWAKKSVSDAASITEQKALEMNVIDGIYENRDSLWKAFHAKFPDTPATVEFDTVQPKLNEVFLSFISNPNVAYGLMAIGALGIYVEISNPGLIFPGAIGAVSLALGAMTTDIIPIRPGAIVLLLIALILFAIEIFVPAATFGIAGLSGAVALLLSGVFLIDMEQSNIHLDPSIWIPAFVIVVAFMGWLAWASIKALKSRSSQQSGYSGLVGKKGEVVQLLSGKKIQVKVTGELWTAELQQDQNVQVGDTITVSEQKGLHLLVRKET